MIYKTLDSVSLKNTILWQCVCVGTATRLDLIKYNKFFPFLARQCEDSKKGNQKCFKLPSSADRLENCTILRLLFWYTRKKKNTGNKNEKES